MPDLDTFQLAFAAALGRTSRRGALERQPGFAVYRNTCVTAAIDALRAGYPVIAEILGEDAFGRAALVYARLHPPRDPVLLAYGETFAAFLEGQPWTTELPYLADVARIERLRTESHLAGDAPALDSQGLSALGPEAWSALRLPLHPAVRFAWLSTPAFTIWRAHVDGFETLEPDWRAEGALFARPFDAVLAAPLGENAFILLDQLRLGRTLGKSAAMVAASHPEVEFGELFYGLVARGVFAEPPLHERTIR